MLKSQEIQDQINSIDLAIQQGSSDAQLNVWEMQKSDLKKELDAALAEEAQQQAHEGRVQDATTEIATYFDTLYVGGQTMRELCADEEAYQILRLSVSQAFIDQATKNSTILSQVQADSQAAIKQANDKVVAIDYLNTALEQDKHQLVISLEDITNKFQAATTLLAEAPSNEETEKLKQEIADLKAQLALKAKADEPIGDAKSQIDAMVQDRENKKTKITNLRLADPSGINTKDYLATDVLTGEEISIHSNYIRSYKEISVSEAEHLRAEAEAVKNSIPSLAEPIAPVDIPVEQVSTFPETEVQTGNTAGDTGVEGISTVSESVEQPTSEVITLESLHARVNELERAVYGKPQQAVA